MTKCRRFKLKFFNALSKLKSSNRQSGLQEVEYSLFLNKEPLKLFTTFLGSEPSLEECVLSLRVFASWQGLCYILGEQTALQTPVGPLHGQLAQTTTASECTTQHWILYISKIKYFCNKCSSSQVSGRCSKGGVLFVCRQPEPELLGLLQRNHSPKEDAGQIDNA